MPFPYVDADRLEQELPLTPEKVGVSDTGWQELLQDFVADESERVEQDNYAGVRYRDIDTVDEIPGIIRESVIRLARARAYAINTDGLESENVGDGASYNYQGLASIRAEVKAELQAADLSRGDGDDGPDDARMSLL